VRTAGADASKLPAEDGEFGLILCDAPCSGTGTLARNPEIKVRLELEDLERQAARQRAILLGALQRLAPGGRLVYSTCSLEPEENEAVVAQVLRQSGARLLPVRGVVEELLQSGRIEAGSGAIEGWMRGEFLRTLPGAGFEGDGFFAAILERTP
jgi:16S rRNA (cytosine967-C5)-methyltransferase